MKLLCKVMPVSGRGYYTYRKAKAKVICLEQVRLVSDFKALFAASKQRDGRRRMAKAGATRAMLWAVIRRGA